MLNFNFMLCFKIIEINYKVKTFSKDPIHIIKYMTKVVISSLRINTSQNEEQYSNGPIHLTL